MAATQTQNTQRQPCRGRIDRVLRVLTTALMKDVPNPLIAEDSIRVVNILEGQRTGVLSHVANDVEDGALHARWLAREWCWQLGRR